MDNIFHFLSIMYTWTDSATSGALHSPLAAQYLQRSLVSLQPDGKKVEQWKHKLTAIE